MMPASASIRTSSQFVCQACETMNDYGRAHGVRWADGVLKYVSSNHLNWMPTQFETLFRFSFAHLAEDNKSLAPTLRVADVPLLDMETCRMSNANGGRSQSILDTMICAGKWIHIPFFCRWLTYVMFSHFQINRTDWGGWGRCMQWWQRRPIKLWDWKSLLFSRTCFMG